MGGFLFHIQDVKDGKVLLYTSIIYKNTQYKDPFWLNFYGGQPNGVREWAKMMWEVSELGSDWVGNFLVSVELRPEEKPILGKGPITNGAIMNKVTTKLSQNFTYELRGEIHFAENLPEDHNYCIKVKWGNFKQDTPLKVIF